MVFAMHIAVCSVRRAFMVLVKSSRVANTSLIKGCSITTRGGAHQSRMNHELTFRLARWNNLAEVLKVSQGIYDGEDFVAVRFHTWMKMQDLAVMLSYSGEKPVGLLVCSVVDEGRTFVSRAARVIREFRGQGVHKMQGKAMDAFVRKTFPNVRRKLLTKHEESFPFGRKLVQQDILSCYVEKANLRSHQTPTGSCSVEVLSCTKDYLCDVIFARPVAQHLFPENFLILDWFPIEPLRSNIDYLIQEQVMYFAVENCTNDTPPRSVSFGVLSPRDASVHWCATVYSSEKDLYEAHVMHQLKKACEVVIEDSFIFTCFQDQRFTMYGRRVLKEQLQLVLDEEESKKTINLYQIDFS